MGKMIDLNRCTGAPLYVIECLLHRKFRQPRRKQILKAYGQKLRISTELKKVGRRLWKQTRRKI